tara:strand:+ start:1825 stop:2022 length:198 start_codon:yes stop_codon:yes gene_type:complete
MINFRTPNWFLLLGVIINFAILLFSFLNFDFFGIILSVLCIGCFIFTYKVNTWERNEKEDKEKNN